MHETLHSEDPALAADRPVAARGEGSATRRRLSGARRSVPSAMLSPQGFLLALILVLSVETALRSEYFLTQANLENIGRQIAVVGILASGTTLLMLTGVIDLSIGAVSALVGLMATKLVVDAGVPFGVAALLAVGTSVLLAAAMGFVIARTKVAAFMLTLGVWTAITGVDLLLQGEFPISLPAGGQYTVLGQGELGGAIPYSVLICAALWVMTGAAMRWSSLLHQAKAVGSNEEAARLSGIAIDRVKLVAYVLSGFCAAVGSIILTARVASGQPSLGTSLPLESVSAVVLGGVSLFGGRGSVIGVAFGVLFVSILSNGLNLLNVSSYTQMMVIGAALIVAVALDQALTRRGK